jgi:hypothetical protein
MKSLPVSLAITVAVTVAACRVCVIVCVVPGAVTVLVALVALQAEQKTVISELRASRQTNDIRKYLLFIFNLPVL